MYIEFEGMRIGGRDQPLIITEYDPPDHSVETSDVTIPGRPGTYAGRDRRVERTHVFTIRTGGGVRNLSAAQELADELTAAWSRGSALGPGQTIPLIMETTRRRRIFGRPRKITAISPDVRAMQGSIEIMAEFVQTDPVAYEEFDTAFSISVLPEPQGGIVTPLVEPIRTATWGGVAYRFVENTGDSASRMAVTFHGPCANPRLTVDGQDVALRGTLNYDQAVTIDGRTSTVLRNDGANVSNMLTSRTRLDSLALSPGSHEIGFSAEDTTMTARASISFASAYNNI